MGYNLYRSRNILNTFKGMSTSDMNQYGAIESYVHYPSGKRDLNGQQVSGPPVDYKSVHSLFNGYTNTTSNSTILSGLQNLNSDYKIWALPVRNNFVEDLLGATSGSGAGTLTTAGKFDTLMFGSSGPVLTKGSFPGLTPNCAWFAMSILSAPVSQGDTGGHLGTIYMSFPDTQYKTNVRLKDLFYPLQARRVEVFADYGLKSNSNGYTGSYNNPNTRWLISAQSRIGTLGYYSASAGFSYDDGIWGVRIGDIVDGAGGSATLGSYSGGDELSFGIQNVNSGDSSTTTLHFGNKIISNNYTYKSVLWTEAT